MRSGQFLVVAAFFSLAAHAQSPGEACNQGQCGSGAFCDFSVVPTPICRALPTAPVPPPAVVAPVAPIAPPVAAPYPAPMAPVSYATPAIAPQPQPQPADAGLFRTGFSEATSDQRAMLHRIGLGYTGRRDVSVQRLTGVDDTLQLGVFNLRYWAGEGWGIDLGLGTSWSNSGQTTSDGDKETPLPGPSEFGGILHLGLPFVASTYKDLSVLVIPEIDLGLANIFIENPDTADRNVAGGGFTLGLGGRVGGELHFGMLGLPQLAVESTVGLTGRFGFGNAKQGKVTTTSFVGAISLPVAQDPLDLVLGNLAIRYYL